MSARSILVMVACLTAGLWWLLWQPATVIPAAPDASSGSQPAGRTVALQASPQLQKSSALPGVEQPVLRSLVARTLTITGRCVTAAKQPLAGVQLRLRARRYEMDEECWRSPGAPHLPEPVPWDAPEPVISAGDGTFLFELPETRLPLRVDAGGPFAVDPKCTRLFTELRQEPVYDAGDVMVHEGYVVRGTVVDNHGNPVPDTLVSLGSIHGYPIAMVRGGRVDFGAVPAGDYAVECLCGKAVPGSVVVGREHDTSELRWVVTRVPVLTCLVVDDRTGEPVPGQQFEPTLRDGPILRGQPWTVCANADGRIWIHGYSDSGNAVQFADDEDDPEPSHYVLAPDRWYEFEAGQAVIRVRAWPKFLVRVQDANGEPVSAFSIVTTNGSPRRIAEIEPGVWSMSDVYPGKHFLYAHVEESPFAVSKVHAFDPVDFARSPLVLTIVPPKPFQVQLRTSEGVALAAKITLRRKHPDAEAEVEWRGGDRWSDHAETASVSSATAQAGSATLLAPANLEGWQLHVWKTATTDYTSVVLTDRHRAAGLIEVRLQTR